MVNPDPGFDLASNRNLHVPIVLKSGSLNPLEPSGPLQACNGIALPLPLLLNNQRIYPGNLKSSEKKYSTM